MNKMTQNGFRYMNEQGAEVDSRFLTSVDVDLRVVLCWDSDNIDVELVVEEPNTRIASSFTVGFQISRSKQWLFSKEQSLM
jgi:hypothetical protein